MLAAVAYDLGYVFPSSLRLRREPGGRAPFPAFVCDNGQFIIADGAPTNVPKSQVILSSDSSQPPPTTEPVVPAPYQSNPIFEHRPYAIELGAVKRFSYITIRPGISNVIGPGDTSVCQFYSSIARRKDAILPCLGSDMAPLLTTVQEYLGVPLVSRSLYSMLYTMTLLKSLNLNLYLMYIDETYASDFLVHRSLP
jgi:hypothetical protein